MCVPRASHWFDEKLNTDRVFQTRSVSQHRFLLEAQHYISEQHAVHLYSGNLPSLNGQRRTRCSTREGVVPRICLALAGQVMRPDCPSCVTTPGRVRYKTAN